MATFEPLKTCSLFFMLTISLSHGTPQNFRPRQNYPTNSLGQNSQIGVFFGGRNILSDMFRPGYVNGMSPLGSFGSMPVSTNNNRFGNMPVSTNNNRFGNMPVSTNNNGFGNMPVSTNNNRFGFPTMLQMPRLDQQNLFPAFTAHNDRPFECTQSADVFGGGAIMPCFGTQKVGYTWNSAARKCVPGPYCSWGSMDIRTYGFNTELECQVKCDIGQLMQPNLPAQGATNQVNRVNRVNAQLN